MRAYTYKLHIHTRKTRGKTTEEEINTNRTDEETLDDD
jgi:hypothetical protein